MTDLEDRIRSGLHDAVDRLPASSHERDLSVVARHRPGRRGVLIALAAFVAVVIIFGVSFLFSTEQESAVPVGVVEDVTVDQFIAETDAAVDALLDAPGIRATYTQSLDARLLQSGWVDYRSNGDFIAIRADQTDNQVVVSATASVGGRRLRADGPLDTSIRWGVGGIQPSPPFPIGFTTTLGGTADDVDVSIPIEPIRLEVSRQNMSDGGSVWTLTAVFPDGENTERWEIDPDGHIRSMSFEAEKSPEPVGDIGVFTGELTYTPVNSPNPLTTPQEGTPVQLDEYPIPEEQPLLP